MNNIAYAKKQRYKIFFRRNIYRLFKIWNLINQFIFRYKPEGINTILVLPKIKDINNLGDIYNRISWGFPKKNNLIIYLLVSKKIMPTNRFNIPIPTLQKNFIKENENIKFIHSLKQINIFSIDKFIITKYQFIPFYCVPPFIGKLLIADKLFYSWVEGNIWKDQYYNTFTKKEQNYYDEICNKNFKRLMNKYKNIKKTYCFLTGPSFSSYENFEFEKNSVKIICNSIIKNDAFLKYIKKPDIIAFADCVFHFGPSKYAAKFREYIMNVVERYNSFIVVPMVTVPLLISHFPKLKNNIIGLKVSENYNFPNVNNLYVKGAISIVTYFMLPIASSISDEICFLGADGRKDDENYWWKHDPSVQFGSLMETVFSTHPSFFRDRIYYDDYINHCNNFEKIINYGEKLGKKYYTISPSYIPALASRQYKNV